MGVGIVEGEKAWQSKQKTREGELTRSLIKSLKWLQPPVGSPPCLGLWVILFAPKHTSQQAYGGHVCSSLQLYSLSIASWVRMLSGPMSFFFFKGPAPCPWWSTRCPQEAAPASLHVWLIDDDPCLGPEQETTWIVILLFFVFIRVDSYTHIILYLHV